MVGEKAAMGINDTAGKVINGREYIIGLIQASRRS